MPHSIRMDVLFLEETKKKSCYNEIKRVNVFVLLALSFMG